MPSDLAVLEEVAEEMDGATPQPAEGKRPVELFHPHLHNQILSNHARFFHPDGTSSDIPVPTFNPKRPTSYRRRVVQAILSRRKNGKRWFFLTPQADPPAMPFRCFIEPSGVQCTKRLRTLQDLYSHVMAKHFEEAKMYTDVLEALKGKLQVNLDPDLMATLATGSEMPKEGPETFHCTVEGCARFFDTKQGRKLHERKGH